MKYLLALSIACSAAFGWVSVGFGSPQVRIEIDSGAYWGEPRMPPFIRYHHYKHHRHHHRPHRRHFRRH